MGRKIKVIWIVFLLGLSGVALLNAVSWRSVAFCDWYTMNIFPIWLHTYARLTSLVPFSVGEIMLILAVVITVFGISLFLFHLFMKGKWKQFVKKFWIGYAWLVLAVLYVMTLNCFILYHNTGFADKYLAKTEKEQLMADLSGTIPAEESDSSETTNYTKKNLAILRDYLVEQCNNRAEKFSRDEDGNVLYEGDIIQVAVNAMEDLGQQYDQLLGEYVTPKYFSNSEFFSQQSIMGYYFPFSLEANINEVMYITNIGPTVCHELSHTRGFMYEEDANMIAYLACIQSEDEFLQYCGYLSVLNYVNNDFYESIGKNDKTYKKHVRISDLVANDNIFLTKENWEEVEKKAVVKTETVKKVSNELMETSLKMNGVEEGTKSYSEVVNLLLDYYENILY